MDLPGRRALTVLILGAVLTAATACTGGSTDGPGEPEQALASARKHLDETSGVELHLTTGKLPDGVDGLEEATGVGTHAPAFEGTVVLLVDGLSLKVPVVAVDGLVFAKLPLTLRYSEIDPGDYGAPDPAQLMNPADGLSSWLADATGTEKGDQVREGATVLTSYSGTLPGESVAGVIPSADKESSFPVTFHITDDGELRSLDVSGPFYGKGHEVDYTITLSGYGTDKDITRP